MDDASTATLRSIIGDVFQAASEDYLRQVLLNAAQASTRTTVAHVTTASSRAVVDELLASGVAVLNLLTGTVGGFGTDVLLPSGAGHLYTLSRRLMEHEKKEVVCAALGRGSNEKWLAQYQRYLKTLLAIAKKGGVAVDTNPTFVTAGSSHMVGTVKGMLGWREAFAGP